MCQFRIFEIKYTLFLTLILGSLAVLSPIKSWSVENLTLLWEPSDDPSEAGYNIYYGTMSHVYTNKVSAGNTTSVVISNLIEGMTYYFAATTYDSSGRESAFSDEIAYSLPMPNPPPVITNMAFNYTAIVGQILRFQVRVNGDGPLAYNLSPEAPAGARINSTNGLFTWLPPVSKASSTNVFSIIVTDSQESPQSTAQMFTIVVGDYIQVSLGSAVVPAGSTIDLASTVYASVPVTNLQITLSYRPDLMNNCTFLSTNPMVGMATVTSIAPDQVLVVINTKAGQSFSGYQSLGDIKFNTVASEMTKTTYINVNNLLALKTDNTPVQNMETDAARVTIVGQESLIEAHLDNGMRNLVIYGPVGASYQIESCNGLTSPTWTDVNASITMTNISQSIQLPSDTSNVTLYRARRIE